MKRNCNFQRNPAYVIGMVLIWSGVLVRHMLEVQGLVLNVTELVCGVGVGMTFVGLLYGSSKTRPLFDRFHAFKLRLLGREEDVPC